MHVLVQHEVQAQKMLTELQETIEWLDLFAMSYGLPDEMVAELHARLEHIERIAARM
jgi:hypothetical protein